MDLYTIWADKEGDISDLDWVNGMKSFFDHLISEGKMVQGGLKAYDTFTHYDIRGYKARW